MTPSLPTSSVVDDHGETLPYPNPSLGAMAEPGEVYGDADAEGDAESHQTSKTILSPRRPPVHGVRRVVLIVSLLVGLLFSTLDTSIVATSLVTISHDLDDFINAPWIVLAYLLTYMSFAVCLSKLSDIYGRRNMLVISWVVFVGFSLGCATAKDMVALIICRAFQGVGASGLYSLTQIGLVEIGPAHRPSLIGAMVGATLAVAFILGPIIGGAVSHLADWRWLFNMNIPFGLVTILAITNLWPEEHVPSLFSWDAFTRIDFIGGTALLCSSGLLVFAVQQAGSQTFEWNSPAIITTLVISGLCWIGFVAWEIRLELWGSKRVEPIFPIGLMLNRVYTSGLIVTLLTGFPYISLSIVIPERFQIVNGESALMAGVHILPLLGACAIGSFLGGAISSRRNNTSLTLLAASSFQLLGVGLMTLVSDAKYTPQYNYGFQAIFGLGVGLSLSAATIMTNIIASEESGRAAAQGAIAQARVLGGCIGLSACNVTFNAHVNRYLAERLTYKQLQDLHRTPLSGIKLPMTLRDLVKDVYSGAFKQEIKIMILVCAVMVFVSLFTLERHPAPLERFTKLSTNRLTSRRESGFAIELKDTSSAQQGL